MVALTVVVLVVVVVVVVCVPPEAAAARALPLAGQHERHHWWRHGCEASRLFKKQAPICILRGSIRCLIRHVRTPHYSLPSKLLSYKRSGKAIS